ncbi:MAG: FAD-dependent oxidoreductase, partial [Bacteroidota bacterium]
SLAQQHIRSKGVDLRLSATVTGFEEIQNGVKVLMKDGKTIDADIVILSIGVRPNTKLATMAGLQLGPAKGIRVNEYLQTSNPAIYAVGDAIEFANPITGQSMNTYLAGPANKQGRICANNLVLGNQYKYKGSVNKAIVQVFDMTIATSGTASKHLKTANIKHIVSTTHSGSHAGYYPGSKQMAIQIAFSPEDGRLFSAHIAGFDGVDKRIDILASVIKRNGTIYELTEFEHAYAPPYSSAKDPVNMSGYVAENILHNRLKVFYYDEVASLPADSILLDVRTAAEFDAGNINRAINIPVDEIRQRLSELPLNKKIYIYCEAGLRGYLAHRMLRQNGYEEVYNLSGGYISWKACNLES